MHRFRNTFTRSRTPTGAEMKTQSSLEVPKQVRSASFDEIQLEAQRANQFLKVHQSSADESSTGISPGLLLQVPQPGAGQRSRSFDLTGAGGEDSQAAVAAAFLDVPKRFQRRKSSSKTPPPCIHCLYLEEYRRLTGVDQRQYYDNSEYQELSYTSSDSDDDDDDDEDDEDGDGDDPDADEPEEDPDFDFNFPGCNVQCNTLLPPPLVSPCGITFTLSPTNGDDIEDGAGAGDDPDGTAILPDIGPILPPPPMFDTPPYHLPPLPLGSLPIGSPPITPCSAYPPPSPTIEVPPCSPAATTDESPGGVPRTRRRSISRQEAIFVEPTGNSLENVSSAEPTTNQDINIIVPEPEPDAAGADGSSSRNQSCESVADQNEFSDNQYHQYHLPRPSLPAAVAADFVRDIYLQVPDLKRDRAASVDSCFTKVTGAKTEELKPPEGELTLLAVPSSGAIRSRSVDIVLPTEEQARYKALALAGTAGTAAGAVGVGAKG